MGVNEKEFLGPVDLCLRPRIRSLSSWTLQELSLKETPLEAAKACMSHARAALRKSDRCSSVNTFPLDTNSSSHLLPVSAARKRVPIGRCFIFSLLAELVSAIPCSP
jgi:hypothetical protein